MQDKSIIATLYKITGTVYFDVKKLLEQGADPNEKKKYEPSPLFIASRLGLFNVVQLLIEYGADADQLKWNDIFYITALGTVDELSLLLSNEINLEIRDHLKRTPLLVSILTGDIQKTNLLIKSGANIKARGHVGQIALEYAILRDDQNMLEWLVLNGANIEEFNTFGNTPLIEASSEGAINCVKKLILLGADINKLNRASFVRSQAITEARTLEVANILINAGADINDCDPRIKYSFLNIKDEEFKNISSVEFKDLSVRKFGSSNPEVCTNKFYYHMVRTGKSAWKAYDNFNCIDSIPRPIWCNDRMGQTTIKLPDGRFVCIAGEHEDHYDPDFCIYNEVIVFDHNKITIYQYPREVFPPTDFHTATYIEGYVYIIGNLGYPEDRKADVPVYRLSISDFSINKIQYSGINPGWLHNHKAELTEDRICISGGELINDGDHSYNRYKYTFNTKTFEWTKTKVSSNEYENYFEPSYKNQGESERSILIVKNDSKWFVLKVIESKRVDLYLGDKVVLDGISHICPTEDYFFLQLCLISKGFNSETEANSSVNSGNWKSDALYFNKLPFQFDRVRFISFEEFTSTEKLAGRNWLLASSENEISTTAALDIT